MGELLFLALLALVGFGGVVVGGRVLTRPLKKLAAAALQVHSGDFDLERLPDSGPREVVTTTAAFNDMASTLKAVEAKAVALAAEDLSDPELLIPLPGSDGPRPAGLGGHPRRQDPRARAAAPAAARGRHPRLAHRAC